MIILKCSDTFYTFILFIKTSQSPEKKKRKKNNGFGFGSINGFFIFLLSQF